MGRPKGSKNKKHILTEQRLCLCGCGASFVCKVNSKKMYMHGHNNRGSHINAGIKRTAEFKENLRQFNLSDKNPRRKPREERICKCGCGKTFVCMVASSRAYINGHNGRITNKGEKNGMFGRKYTKEESVMHSIRMTGFKRTSEQKKNYSIAAAKRIASGKNHSFGEHGHLILPRLGEKIYYASSYEKAALLNIDKCEFVSFIQKDKLRLPYELSDGFHCYVVDFVITLNTGHICLVEVKADWALNDLVTKTKLEVAKRFAEENGFVFQVWGKEICFNHNSVTTKLTEAIQLATANSYINERRYSLTPAVMQGRRQK